MPHHTSKKHKSLRKTHKKPTMSNKGYAIVKRIRHKGKPAPMHNINYAIRASLIPANNNNMAMNAAHAEESMAMNQDLRRSSRHASAVASQRMSKQSKKAKKGTQKKWKGVRYNYYNISSNQGAPRKSVYYHLPASSAAASASASNLNKLFASMTI